MRILTIESTCDETAAAVVDDELRVLGSVVASQDALHQRFRGVVPEIAARAHVERMLPVIDEAMRRASTVWDDIDAVAVAVTPGLAGSLVVGLVAAKTLCLALDKPLVAVNHLHAHIYACRIARGADIFPCVGLIVSGGHSSLYHCRGPTEFELLGQTIDDAAGEAFDKVAAMLGLPYPGGPALAGAAATGDASRFHLPRPLLGDPSRLDFSFSGLKTAVRYALAGVGKIDFAELDLDPRLVADIAAGFQTAIVDCLVGKSMLAIDRAGLARLCVGGGVAANDHFRSRLESACAAGGVELIIAPRELCTDNAVMGAIAFEHIKVGAVAPLDLDITPGLVRGGPSA
ncbi:MAG: tRNA (adenosine(37)-N6)-threonylcarbamoyltransferase complex transferase subunit TsaD [Planctomycetes bacterium]|nr:tRNA (adenosine(37)-N6)-threonylcarbamoyltransferase complex transferase subunit TsaD [Planctomycetota bacterium]